MSDLKLNLKLNQQLIMTPQLQQAIKLLLMSRQELKEAINLELNENPILEEEYDNKELILKSTKIEKTDIFEWQKYADSFNSNSSTPYKANKIEDHFLNIENMAYEKDNLIEYLFWQLRMTGVSEKEEAFGEYLIENINEDGYLISDLKDLIKQFKLFNISFEEAEEVLLKIQEFDPIGVAARDLKECLLLQVRQLELKDTNIITIIKEYLSDLEKKNYPALAKKLNIDVDKAVELSKIILSLEPKPGRLFSSSSIQYIVPDVYVLKIGEEYLVVLNEEGLPKLKISNYYKDMLNSEDLTNNKEAKDYIQDKIKNAVALIKSVEHRQKTIYKVTETIVKKQKDFLDKGVSFLKPMILRDIAEDIQMHESTISRVTTNKFVHTPQGIFELKYFFNNPISSVGGGQDIASESVRERIKEIILKEDNKAPLSDQEIAEELKKFDIDIARRTVSKYREILGILSSNKRKKYI